MKSSTVRLSWLLAAVALLPATVTCGNDDDDDDSGPAARSGGSGGSSESTAGAGGSTVAGAAGAAGARASGGTEPTAGTTGSGGAEPTGGRTSSGGAEPTAGAAGSGMAGAAGQVNPLPPRNEIIVHGTTIATYDVTAAEGGDLELPGGAVLSIPADAVPDDITVTVTAPEGQDSSSQIQKYRLEPAGLTFDPPAVLTIPYEDTPEGEPLIQALQFSDLNPEVDLGWELSNAEDLTVLEHDTEANLLRMQLDHFSFVALAIGVHKYAYLVKRIPARYLEPGDLLFVLTADGNGRYPNWKPGHVGVFVGGSTPCVEGESDRVIESTPPSVQANTLGNFMVESGHVYLGAYIPGGEDNITVGDRAGVVQYCENVMGADYALVGSGNLETLEFSCVGLAEAAYDSIDKGVISGFEEALVSTPLEMYLGSIQRMSITVEAGDLIEIPIRGVVLHPDSPSLLTHGRGWYCSGNAYPCIGAVAETDIDITMGGNPPEDATFEDRGNKRYLFSWQTEGTDAGRTYYITFTLTTTPYVTTVFDNPEALPTQTEDEILSIEVVPCPVESACVSPETDTAVTVGQNLEVTEEEVCGEMTARAILFLIHSSESVPQQPVANDHTTTTRTAAVTEEFTQGSADTTFNQSTFDCGDGPNGYTLCAEPLTPFPAGPALILMNVLAGDIPLNDPTNYYQYGFVFDADGDTTNNYQPSAAYPNDFFKDTDLWYVANYDPASGWSLSVTDARNGTTAAVSSAARVIISGNSITLVVPMSEFSVAAPDYRVTAFRHTGDWGMVDPYDYSGSIWPAVADGLETMQ